MRWWGGGAAFCRCRHRSQAPTAELAPVLTQPSWRRSYPAALQDQQVTAAPLRCRTNMFDQAAVLGGMLEEFLRDLGRAMQPLGEALAMMRVLSDVALEQGRAQEG